jgi:hypothetical protein
MPASQAHLGVRTARLLRTFSCAVALLLAACDGEGEASPPDGAAPLSIQTDLCNGRCESNEVCLPDEGGGHSCALICANQLHCWSGCCLRVQELDTNVCRPSSLCYGPGR